MAEKRGLPKGITNNPNGRPKGSKNKFSYDARTFIYDNVANDRFVKDLFTDIDAIKEADKRAKLKLELIKLFVPVLSMMLKKKSRISEVLFSINFPEILFD